MYLPFSPQPAKPAFCYHGSPATAQATLAAPAVSSWGLPARVPAPASPQAHLLCSPHLLRLMQPHQPPFYNSNPTNPCPFPGLGTCSSHSPRFSPPALTWMVHSHPSGLGSDIHSQRDLSWTTHGVWPWEHHLTSLWFSFSSISEEIIVPLPYGCYKD